MKAIIQRFGSDTTLLTVCISLLVMGYMMVASASLHLGTRFFDNAFHYPIRQMIHIVLGIISASVIVSVDMEFWKKSSSWLFIVGLVLLVLVLLVGVKVNGSTRWLSLGFMRIQVSEIVKLVSVLYIASYVTRYQDNIRKSNYALFKPLGLFSIAGLLLLLEPDFGSVVVIFTIAMGIMFLSGARLWQFFIVLLTLGGLASMLVYFSPYRWMRMTSFIDPWNDGDKGLGSGFQLIQALISFGRGEWFGVGIGNGLQKLFYLPEGHTDFLFSVIAEESGLFGVTVIIVLFSLLVWRAFAIASHAEKANQDFSALVAYGLGIWFGFQAFVNMGVNMGLLPTKGLTLPLMSYGGGSMIIMCSALALLFRIQSEAQLALASTPRRKRQW